MGCVMLSIVSANKFSERLKLVRENHNMSQRKLSDELGMGSTVVYFYESGKKVPSIEVLHKLCEYFNVSSDYLLGLSDEPLGGTPESVKRKLEEAERNKAELDKLSKMFDDFAEKISKHYHQQ